MSDNLQVPLLTEENIQNLILIDIYFSLQKCFTNNSITPKF